MALVVFDFALDLDIVVSFALIVFAVDLWRW